MTSNDVQRVNAMPSGNGLDVENVAMLGASLAGMGLEVLEVQGLLAAVHRVSLQVSINSMSDVLDKVTKVHRSRAVHIVTRINMLPSMGGYVNKLQVLNIINSVLNTSPQQQQ